MKRTRTRVLGRIATLVLLGPIVVPAQEADLIRPDPTFLDSPCPDLPAGARLVPYGVVVQIRHGNSPIALPVVPELPEVHYPNARLHGGQVIETSEELRLALGVPPEADDGTSAGPGVTIDWSASRIVVFEQFTSYRLGAMYGQTVLSGIYEDAGALIIHTTHTNYGPCQGIRQDSAWFSFESEYLLLAVPRNLNPITHWNCRIGDCPPDIP